MITADALRCRREYVTYLPERGAHWILTVKSNQLHLHPQLAALPWRAVPAATRGHGRREIRTLKVLTISTGIDFPPSRRRSAAAANNTPCTTKPVFMTSYSGEQTVRLSTFPPQDGTPRSLMKL